VNDPSIVADADIGAQIAVASNLLQLYTLSPDALIRPDRLTFTRPGTLRTIDAD
jgi:hypothetical protein